MSYVVGQDVAERFDGNTLVFVLSTDPYNLYDYEYGIAVPGKIYDDYVKEHPGEEIPYNAPGNYYMSGRESERPIYVEVFESDGTKVIDQAAGVRLSGGYSRVPDQKSLRLIARKSYDPDNGKFKYAFFEGAQTADGVPVSEFDRIVSATAPTTASSQASGTTFPEAGAGLRLPGDAALHSGGGVPKRRVLWVLLGARELQR